MDNNKIASKIAQSLLAFEFPTQEALDKYLKEHPDADKRNHIVRKEFKRELEKRPKIDWSNEGGFYPRLIYGEPKMGMDNKKIASALLKVARGMLADTPLDIGKVYQVVTEFSAYWVEGHEAVSPYSGETSTAVNLLEGNLVKVLRKRGNWYEAKLLHPIRLTDNGKTFTHQGEVLISSMDTGNLMEK